MRRIVFAGVAAGIAAASLLSCSGSGASPSPNPGGGVPPPVVNTPPQIKSITVSDTRVEVGTPVTVTAVVEDQETPVANLTYTWSADTGTFTGTGPIVNWSPGADAKTPADYVLTLTVTERYTSGSTTAENKVTGTTTAHVNNSPQELADLSMRFLGDFANSSVPPEKCVAEFSDSCGGKNAEFGDIKGNRHDFLITSSTLRPTGVELAPSRLTAKVHTFCAFTSRVITTQPETEGCRQVPGACPFNSVGSVSGDCWTTNLYEKGRWWLCESHFTGQSTSVAFGQAFFGIRRPEVP